MFNNSTNQTTKAITNPYNNLIAYYSLFLTVYGTVGNIVTIMVTSRRRLRRTPTFVFLSFKIVFDTITLYFWNLNSAIFVYYGFQLGDFNIWACRTTAFFGALSSESAIYIMVNKLNFFVCGCVLPDYFNIYLKKKTCHRLP